jgi:CheY-like chemotaxis protein
MQPVRILVVEDNPNDAELIGMALSRMKMRTEVSYARDKKEAAAALASESFNLVLLDMKLPNGRGIDLLKTMQRSPRAVPAVMLTSYVNPSDKLEAMREGAQGYLDKTLMLLHEGSLEPEIEAGLARHEGRIREVTAALDLARKING